MKRENQHYVPRFILKQFLSDKSKEQVTVYDKSTDRIFNVSVTKIMSENNFNNFRFEDYIVSYEPVVSQIEQNVLPHYMSVIKDGKLNGSIEQRVGLAFLIAFQMIRTKAHRSMISNIETKIKTLVEDQGGQLKDIKGWKPLDEDGLKHFHLTHMYNELPEYAQRIAEKTIFLVEAPPDKAFYLSDNPVTLDNLETYGPYGNIGLAVRGIQIYLPLSDKILLCAWCPSIFGKVQTDVENTLKEVSATAINRVLQGRMTAGGMKKIMQEAKSIVEENPIYHEIKTGGKVKAKDVHMDYFNSLQTGSASRYVVCPLGDLALARRHNKEFPQLARGMMFR